MKDASSTAIYGARGANGVIIVTTKSGKEGKVQVDFGASFGFKKVTKMTEVMSPYDLWLINVKSVRWITEIIMIWISGNQSMVLTIRMRYSDEQVISSNIM